MLSGWPSGPSGGHSHHVVPPGVAQVVLQLDAERAVVPEAVDAAVDLGGREDEAAALASATIRSISSEPLGLGIVVGGESPRTAESLPLPVPTPYASGTVSPIPRVRADFLPDRPACPQGWRRCGLELQRSPRFLVP